MIRITINAVTQDNKEEPDGDPWNNKPERQLFIYFDDSTHADEWAIITIDEIAYRIERNDIKRALKALSNS